MQDFETYLEVEAGLSKATSQAYRHDIKELMLFTNDSPISASLINNFLFYQKRIKAKNTARRKQMSIRSYCSFLISNDAIDKSILEQIDSIGIEVPPMKIVSDASVNQMIARIDGRNGQRNLAIFLLLCDCGLRASEICSLEKANINFNNRTLRVCGKGCSERIVPFSERCSKAMRQQISETDQCEIKIFGSNLTRNTITDMITRLGYKVSAGHVTSHLLRHYCATTLLNNGMDIEMIQRFLGHKNLCSTQIYLNTNDERLRSVHLSCHPRR